MIQEMNKTNIPIIASLGHVENITDLASWDGADFKTKLPLNTGILLHCVSEYPAKHPKLSKMKQLQLYVWEQYKAFAPYIGYSHHGTDWREIVRATELGSVFCEFHYTLDKTMAGSDHWWSLDSTDLKQLAEAIK